MKKSKILSILLLVTCVLTFVVGCTNNSSNVSSEPSRTPSKSEIKIALRNMENWSTLGTTFKKMVKQIFQLTIGGKLIKELGTTGNLFDLFKQDSASTKQVMQNFGSLYYLEPKGIQTFSYITDSVKIAAASTGGDTTGKPITIIRDAIITHADGTKETVNVVGLNGLMTSKTEATSLATAIYAGCQVQNEYIYDAYYAIYNSLKGTEDKSLYIIGISLGGMAAQQLAGLDNLTNFFNVKYIITVASPLISPEAIDYTKTTVRRMVDVDDIVPQLSASFNGDYQTKHGEKNYAIVRNHPDYNTFVGSHALGYLDPKLWGKDANEFGYDPVDVLGYENGGATITVDFSKMTHHDAPEVEEQGNKEIDKIQQ